MWIRARRHWIVLQVGVGHEKHRHHGRRHRDFVSANGRLGEVLQRDRRVVPFNEVSNHRPGILHAVDPRHFTAAMLRVERVADDEIDRNAIAPSVVKRHRRMLQSDGAVSHRQHRLAFDFGVAMRHRNRRLFVHARDELGILVVAVIDDRFVQSAETSTGIREEILESDRLEDVEHEVRARAIDDPRFGDRSFSLLSAFDPRLRNKRGRAGCGCF